MACIQFKDIVENEKDVHLQNEKRFCIIIITKNHLLRCALKNEVSTDGNRKGVLYRNGNVMPPYFGRFEDDRNVSANTHLVECG